MSDDIALKCINTIRTLSMDAVQAANSGHPGTPMAMAPVAYEIWNHHMRYDPEAPHWPNRDRFVLSIGHASMLLYSMLHLTQTKDKGELSINIDDIKSFRQLHSKCAGHPESHVAAGIETTTGPLGQGAANSVGMAIASKWQAEYFNKPGCELFDYDVYVIAGDGCMMEGVTSEAASLAAHLKLSNLCWFYDNNKITIEGNTKLAFTEDVGARFKGYGWKVTHVKDANDLDALSKAVEFFKNNDDAPTLIIVDSHIAWGAPTKQDTHDAHGSPLGEGEISATKAVYGWTHEKWHVPAEVPAHFKANIGARGATARAAWEAKFAEYKSKFPKLADHLECMQANKLPKGWDANLPAFKADAKGVAGRSASGKVLNALAKNIPWLLGGSADLAPSTKTLLDGESDFCAEDYSGRNFHFGVREHAMGSIINGMSLSKLRPYGAGFLIFSDYSRATFRLGAIMGIAPIYVFTHDSIGVGEDGPTHQPIEHLASLRAIPGLSLFRPGDANEITEAWKVVLQNNHQPAVFAFTRQDMPVFDRSKYNSAEGVAKGGYVLADSDGDPEVILISSGSEVSLCVDAYEELKTEGINARVVSLASWDLFEKQSQEYRDSVLPPNITARVAVEMASTFGWERYVGMTGAIIGMRSYGASAPLKDMLPYFGFTVEKVVEAAKGQVARKS
ncbi:MAG: transketolase [Planctomycetota bacterium]|nr:transketolase [Planctomycetota bacterium]